MITQDNNLKIALQQFTGTETFYYIPLIKTRFTDGIKFLAEHAHCYWLVTDTSIVGKSLIPRSPFITIDFKKFNGQERETMGCSAMITYGDGNGITLDEQKYHATDFPLDELRLFFTDNVLMLPSEY